MINTYKNLKKTSRSSVVKGDDVIKYAISNLKKIIMFQKFINLVDLIFEL